MAANLGKFERILLGLSINNNKIIFIVQNKHIKSNNEGKLLGNFHWPQNYFYKAHETKNKSIYKINKRTPRLIYDTEDATFEDLLGRDKSRTFHKDNLHKLLVEIYKLIH